MNIESIRRLCDADSIQWSLHALKRMRERRITSDEVIGCIQTGEIIEEYPDDRPLPSCLIYGVVMTRNLHTVVGSSDTLISIITAYEPDPDEWDPDFKTRKEPA